MNSLKDYHPVILFIYFFYVIFISIFSFNPIILIFGFIGAVSYCLLVCERKRIIKSLLFCIIVFLAITITNPLFSHNGKTVLFFINDNRITAEAFIYGAVLGLAVIEVFFWFKSFNLVFDSERIIFLLGKISPKIALVVSMTLHFIPDLIKHYREIYRAQVFYINSRLKRCIYSFSAVITLSMENSIITSDSMKARGYGLNKRTFYTRFKLCTDDIILLVISTLLFFLSVVFKTQFEFYPALEIKSLGFLNLISIISFFILALLPFIIELKEGIKWKYSISKI